MTARIGGGTSHALASEVEVAGEALATAIGQLHVVECRTFQTVAGVGGVAGVAHGVRALHTRRCISIL